VPGAPVASPQLRPEAPRRRASWNGSIDGDVPPGFGLDLVEVHGAEGASDARALLRRRLKDDEPVGHIERRPISPTLIVEIRRLEKRALCARSLITTADKPGTVYLYLIHSRSPCEERQSGMWARPRRTLAP
jgi:hypothetical protein